MELNVSAVAASRLAPMLHADKALILDINDGIGPYSRPSKTSGQAKFNLLILPRTNVPDVYDAHLDSPVGPVLIKSYTSGFFKATNCQIKCNFLPKKTSDGVFQTKTLRGRLFKSLTNFAIS